MPAVLLIGCGGQGPPTYQAGGKVVFSDGTPLGGGTIEFRPVRAEKSVTARGTIQPDGTFQLSTFEPDDGAIEGEHLVLISPAPPRRIGEPVDPRMEIDLRYTQFSTSGLKCTVSRDVGENRFPILVERSRK